jgi:hypothetical protein
VKTIFAIGALMLASCSDPDFQRHLNEMAYGAAAGAQAGAAAHAQYVDEPRQRALEAAAALSQGRTDRETSERLDAIENQLNNAQWGLLPPPQQPHW